MREGLLTQQSSQRVYNLIRSAIRTGVLTWGSVLDEHELSRSTATSRNAVREGLTQLAADGMISRIRRQGTSVVARVHVLPVSAGRRSEVFDFSLVALEERIVPVTTLLAALMQTEAASVRMSEYLMYRDGVPFGVQTSYVGLDDRSLLGARIDRDQSSGVPDHQSMAKAFLDLHGVSLHSVETAVEAITSDRRTAQLLQIGEGRPLLLRERRLSDEAGRFVELIYTSFRADQASMHSRLVLDEDGTVRESSDSDLTDD